LPVLQLPLALLALLALLVLPPPPPVQQPLPALQLLRLESGPPWGRWQVAPEPLPQVLLRPPVGLVAPGVEVAQEAPRQLLRARSTHLFLCCIPITP
jgi:hypothetical protein